MGPYEILERVGEVAYRLALPMDPAKVHNMFHVSKLRKYVHDPSHIIQPKTIELDQNLTVEERAIEILDIKTKNTCNKTIKIIKVLWSKQKREEATWRM